MKASELRINNIVNRQGAEIRVDGSDIKWLEDESYLGIEPIPLTKEWLFKFGFEESRSSYDDYILKLDNNYNNLIWVDFITKELYVVTDNSDWIKVNGFNVHQLQNLYFALTGEEIQCKE